MYLYPEHLAGKGHLFLWSLKDILIIIIGAVISAAIAVMTEVIIVGVGIGVYAFLTMRLEDTTIADYLTYAFRYCISKQQVFYWRWKD